MFHRFRTYFELDHRQAKIHLFLLFITVLIVCSPMLTYYLYPFLNKGEEIVLTVDRLDWDQDSLLSSAMVSPEFSKVKKRIDEMTEADWISAGLPVFLSKRIMKYQSKGAGLKKVKDLYKIYGIDSAHVHRVSTYVVDVKEENEKKNRTPTLSSKQRLIIDINTSDSLSLESLPAIGPVLASRIIKYRTLLKGYVHQDQYKEIYGISPEALEVLCRRTKITISPCGVLHKMDYAQLNAHPYLSAKDAGYILKQLKLNQELCWETLKSGLSSKAQEHLKHLELYYPCKEDVITQ